MTSGTGTECSCSGYRSPVGDSVPRRGKGGEQDDRSECCTARRILRGRDRDWADRKSSSLSRKKKGSPSSLGWAAAEIENKWTGVRPRGRFGGRQEGTDKAARCCWNRGADVAFSPLRRQTNRDTFTGQRGTPHAHARADLNIELVPWVPLGLFWFPLARRRPQNRRNGASCTGRVLPLLWCARLGLAILQMQSHE